MSPHEKRSIAVQSQYMQERLRSAHVGSPRLESEIMLEAVTGLDRVQLYTNSDKELTPIEIEQANHFLDRRCDGEPIAYLLGRREFYSRSFFVNDHVLIPRPETEQLVDLAVNVIDQLERVYDRPLIVGDICTGSGIIAICLKLERPNVMIIGGDYSLDALAVARRNMNHWKVEIPFFCSDLLSGVSVKKKLDVIVANPPYLKKHEISGLSKEVKREPWIALDGGIDGMDLIRSIIVQAEKHLHPGGALLLEIGHGQAIPVMREMVNHSFVTVQVITDFFGEERFLVGMYLENKIA